MRPQSLSTKLSPPFNLVFRYFLSAFLFYIILFIFLFKYYEPLRGYFISFQIAFLVHMFFLGFVLNVIFGAVFQLIPVALEKAIYSITLAKWQFYIYEPGVILMLYGFYNTDTNILSLGTILVFTSITLFVFNFFMSTKGINFTNITAKFLTVANLLLLMGAIIGLIMSVNMKFNILNINYVDGIFMHIVFMVFGFIFMNIMGLSMVLLPMFSLSHKYSNKFINFGFYGMVSSIVGFEIFVDFKWLRTIFFVFILVSIGLYLAQVYEIYRHKPKGRDDIYIKGMFYSHIFIFLAILGFFYSPIIFGIFILFGFLQTFISSNLYKIVPFLVWFHRFSPLVGKKHVPMLSDMLKKKLSIAHTNFFLAGLFLLVTSLVFNMKSLYTIACAFLFLGALFFLGNMFYVLSSK